MSGISVSVVIPARNAAGTLDLQLGALARQDVRGSWEVIVSDNGSIDETTAVVETWASKVPRLRLIECKRPGTNAARNDGVGAAAADRILFCDADDLVSTGWVREMAAALDSFDVVGGRLDYLRLNTPFIRGTRPHSGSERLPTTFGDLPFAIGASMGMRRSVFEAIAGFDESFMTGSTEVDFCLRSQYAGFTLGFVRDAVVHYRLRSRLGPFAHQYYMYALGEAGLYAKHCALGRLPEQSRREQCSVLFLYVKRLAHVERLVKPEHRWRYVRWAAGFVGSIRDLARYGVAV